MGFVRDLAKAGTLGLAGMALAGKKKPRPSAPQSMMINSVSTPRPTSMIGTSRGGY